VVKVQRRRRLEHGGQSIKRWLEQFKEKDNVLHKNGADSRHISRIYIRHDSRELQMSRTTDEKFLHRRLKQH